MARHRSKSQKDRDRRLIAELYLQGLYQEEIAERLGITQATVSRDLKYLSDQWQKSAEQDTATLKAELKQKYLLAWREATAAWQRSKEDAETTIQEMIEGGDSGNGQQRLKASTRKEGQSGNPALLAQAQAALKAIREMFGVDVKNDPGSSEDKPIYIAQIKEIVVNRESVDNSE